MSKKTMMMSVLVAAILMLGGVASAQTRQFVDLTLVPQERKAALSMTTQQEVRINVLQKNYRDTFFALQGTISGLVELKTDLQRQNTLTRARDKAIMEQITKASARVRSERDALRVNIFNVLDDGQKFHLKVICENEKWLRPNVKLVCHLDFAKHLPEAPEVTESKSPEQLRAEAEEARRQDVEALEAKEHQKAEAERQKAEAEQRNAEEERREAERNEANKGHLSPEEQEAIRLEDERQARMADAKAKAEANHNHRDPRDA